MLNLPDVPINLVQSPEQLKATVQKKIQFAICCNSNVIGIDHYVTFSLSDD
jgi:hypothetical protein